MASEVAETTAAETTPRADRTSVSVVIPSLNGDPITTASVPAGIETVTVTDGNRAEARNRGAARTTGDVLVFADDDVRFDHNLFWDVVDAAANGAVAGLHDFDFDLLITRLFAIHRRTFDALGGFDERMAHMEDTEFCLRARRAGYPLRRFPRDAVEHVAHDNGVTTADRLRYSAYLAVKYPRRWPPHFLRMVINR